MSWNGTVRCRECYGTGHNKRTCPDLTERLKRRAQQELDNGSGKEGYWGAQYAKRTGTYIDGTSAKELRATRRGSTRRCKYCANTGHNRRTCTILKTDRAAFISSALSFRSRIVADMKERGLGIGCLIQTERWGDKHLMLCEQVAWHHISHRMGNADLFSGRLVNNMHHFNAGYPEGDFNSSSYHTYTVPGPIAAEAVACTVPADFLLETSESLLSLCANHFEDAHSECYHENRYS